MPFVYILRCADGTLYTGCARDPAQRVALHNRGRGARYTKGRRPVRLVYLETRRTIGAALRREHAIKQLSRLEKHALIDDARLAIAGGPAKVEIPPTGGAKHPRAAVLPRRRSKTPAN